MKYVLIVIFFNAASGFTAEFDDVDSCERAAKATHTIARVRTVCTPKGYESPMERPRKLPQGNEQQG